MAATCSPPHVPAQKRNITKITPTMLSLFLSLIILFFLLRNPIAIDNVTIGPNHKSRRSGDLGPIVR